MAAGGVGSGGVEGGVWVEGGVFGGGVSGCGACANTMPRGSLAAEGVCDGAGVVAGSPTDSGLITSPGSFGSNAIARRASAAGGTIGGRGVARGLAAPLVVSGGGACAIPMSAAIMDMTVEIADVPSSRPKRRELDMMEPQMPDLDQLADSRSRRCASIAVKCREPR